MRKLPYGHAVAVGSTKVVVVVIIIIIIIIIILQGLGQRPVAVQNFNF
jgi:hypothetical protein